MAYVYDNKTYRNLQQQVKENMENIAELQDLKPVGIDVAGIVADYSSLPSSAEQGKVYAVGTSSPYELYVYNNSSWVDFGEFPKAGPQGEQGPQGEPGRQGPRGLTGQQGPRGYTGAPGTPGQAGPQGQTGPKGDTGLVDAFAKDAASITAVGQAYVDANGYLQVCTSLSPLTFEQGGYIKGPMGERGPSGQQGVQGIQGPKGDTGPEGPKGEPGLTASVEVNGQVYTADDAGKITLPNYTDEVSWGNIKGNLNNQTDLKQSLGAKQNVISDLADIREGAALGKTSLQDDILPILVTKNTEQTITGKKTFNGKVAFGDENGEGGIIYGKVLSSPGEPQLNLASGKNADNRYESSILLKSSNSDYESDLGPSIYFKGDLKPLRNTNIGYINNQIKDLYISGNLTDGPNKVSVANIASKSELPTKTSQLTNDSNFVTSNSLATVATSGSYNDLIDKPTITTVSGVNDGTNWTSLTIGSDTYGLGGGEVPADVATKTYVSEQLATKQDKLDSYSDSASVANNKLTINYKVKQEDGTYSDVPVEFSGGSNYTFTDGLTETGGVVKFNYNNLFGTVASNNTTKINADYYGIDIKNDGSHLLLESWDPGSVNYGGMIAVGTHGSSYAGLDFIYYKELNNEHCAIVPASNDDTARNNIDLGSSSIKFKTLYCTNLSDGTTTKTMTEVISGTTEEWTFTLSDGTTVTKKVKLGE